MSEELEKRLAADGEASAELADGLWSRIEEDLDRGGLHDSLVSLPTRTRRVLALLMLGLGGGLIMAIQSFRADLDQGGWLTFVACSAVYGIGAVIAMAYALRSRSDAPAPPGAAIAVALLGLVLWAVLAPWPGAHDVPSEAHIHCFGMSGIAVALTTLWVAMLDRARTPTPWRVGLAALGAGMAAFAFQGAMCPGAGTAHMLLGHAGAGVVGAIVAMAGASALQRVQEARLLRRS